jgi:hypothetical protein
MIANCTPRETPDFDTHSKFALVMRTLVNRDYNLSVVSKKSKEKLLQFQRCLLDLVSEQETITLLHWPSEYVLKPDKISLTDASARRYLEELLSYTRRALERKRTFSSTSSESVSSASSASKRTSTPLKEMITSSSHRAWSMKSKNYSLT